METNNFNKSEINLNELVGKLKKEDNRNLRITKGFQIMMWIFAPLYLALFLLDPHHNAQPAQRWAGVAYATAFTVFALYFRKYYKIYSKVDYSLPTAEMLQQVVNRYQLWRWDLLIIIVPVVLVNVGQILSGYGEDGMYENTSEILTGMLIYYGMIAVSFCVGVFMWSKRQKPLRDNAILLLKELGE